MTDTLNSLLSLYRLVRQQRHLTIQPQLDQLAESITETLTEIAQQEQAWTTIEDATLGCCRRIFIRDARDLITTDDFQNFIAQLAAVAGTDLDATARTVLANPTEHWQLRALIVPLRIGQYQILMQPRYTYRIRLALGTWQQSLEAAVVTADSIVHQMRSHTLQWVEVQQQLQGSNFQLDLAEPQQMQLRQEIACLVVYIGTLICVRRLSAGFTYP